MWEKQWEFLTCPQGIPELIVRPAEEQVFYNYQEVTQDLIAHGG
jgi:hypothetical protein